MINEFLFNKSDLFCQSVTKVTDKEMIHETVEIDNPCYHCYTGAIGECYSIGCKYVSYLWSCDLEEDYKVEIKKEDIRRH